MKQSKKCWPSTTFAYFVELTEISRPYRAPNIERDNFVLSMLFSLMKTAPRVVVNKEAAAIGWCSAEGYVFVDLSEDEKTIRFIDPDYHDLNPSYTGSTIDYAAAT